MEKHRTRAQDAAKGIMIIAVIFFHCYMMSFTDYRDSIKSFNISMVLFPFLLSSFFFYTGYNYTPSERTIKQNIVRRAKQLLIPMVVAIVISTVLISSMELIYNHDNVGETFRDIGNSLLYILMSEPLSLMIGFPKVGGTIFPLILSLGLIWFLYSLFICSIFFYLLVRFTNKKLTTLISVVIALLMLAFCLGQFVGAYLPYTVQCYPVILAIMLTAAYLRQSHFLNRRVETKKDTVFFYVNMVVAEAIIIGICLLCYFQFGALITGTMPGGQFDPVLKGFDAFIAYIFGILGTFFIHSLCRLIKKVPVLGVSLQWVGNHSAIFYLFHPIFLDLVSIVVFQKKAVWGIGQAFFYVAATVILLTGTCLLLDLLFKKKHPDKEATEEIRNIEAPEDI